MSEKADKRIAIAKTEDALAFVRDLQMKFAGRPVDAEALRVELAKHDLQTLRGYAARIVTDLLAPPVEEPAGKPMKRPSPSRRKPRKP
jgi:hypothetical protein